MVRFHHGKQIFNSIIHFLILVIMKLFRILAIILSIVTMLNGIVCLFLQPFNTAVTNDRFFGFSILLGNLFACLFFWANKQINKQNNIYNF